MKNLLVILLFLPFTFFGQSQSEALLFEVVNLKVISGKEKAFEAAVKKHNQAYHKAGSMHNARLYYNINGPDGGTYSWIMGPTNFTAMDTRPRDEGHDDAALQRNGAHIRAYDPEAMTEAKGLLDHIDYADGIYDCLDGADAVVILTEWDQFRALDLMRVKNLLKAPIFIDLRNIYRPDDMQALGFDYISIGRH